LGYVLILLSIASAWLYFWGGKPSFFNVKTFAFVSVYLEKKYFEVIKTNLLDEMAAILLICGIAAICFSKEKKEKPVYNILRANAMFKAVVFTVLLLVFSILFVYGIAIFFMASFTIVFLLIIYYALFKASLLKLKSPFND
jgi:hypothetical protein